MTVAKTVEISASSPESFDHAIHEGIQRAHDSLKDVKGAWVKEQKVVTDNGKITEYRVMMNVTFVLKR